MHRPTRNAGAVLVALAIIWLLLSWFIDTDRESVEKRSRQFVQAVPKDDWKTFQSLLQPDATLSLTGLPALYHNAQQITKAAQSARQQAGLQSVIVRSVQVDGSGSQLTSNVDLFTIQEQTAGRPLPSTWRFEWVNGPEGWTIYEIHALKIGEGSIGEELGRRFPRVP